MMNVITHPAFLWTVGGLLVSGVIFWFISYVAASYFVIKNTLRRNTPDQWSREMPSDLAPQSRVMYETGLAWAAENADAMTEVHIVNGGLNLYGEYYDFGNRRCVIVLSGRTETLKYGYYFAIPYAKDGCNVLVLDPRAHGKSDGEFNTFGFEESGDVKAWVRYMQETYAIDSIVFHGICIGAAGGVLALTSEDCPAGIDGIVTEGMFPNFGESMKNHLIERKKPVFLLYQMIDWRMRRYTGHSMSRGPIDVIDRLSVPLLMLHSREDRYSTPEYAQKLFERAGSAEKKLVWFDHGEHSMLRITDTALYDGAIAEFLKTLPNKKEQQEKEKNDVLQILRK